MSLSITLENKDAALDLIKAMGPLTDGERAAVAAELGRLLQRHLRSRDDTHAHEYPDGGRRSHFWRKAAESVTFGSDSDSAFVSVTHQGVRLRYAGAPDGLKPVNAESLAIPATGIAYGRLPREFGDLHVVVFKGKGKAALVQRREGEASGTVLFWLVKKTKPVVGDPTVLPPSNVVFGMAVMRIRQMRSRRMKPNG